nr:hypothetical protein [Amycolatopsis sp. CA-128772]
MPQIVQPDRRQPGLTSQLLEPGGDIGRVQRAAVRLGEQQVGVDPVAAKPGTSRVLIGLMLAQHDDSVSVQGNEPFGRGGLGRGLAGLPAVLHDLVCHLQRGRIQVGVRTPLPARLPATEPDVRDQALFDRRAQHRSQRLADPPDRGGSDRALPLHRLDLAGVSTGPVFGDHVVVLDDRIEHPLQVRHPQLVPADVPEVRPEVEAHVRLVRAVGVAAAGLLFLRQEPGEHIVHQRVLQHLGPGALM